MLNLTHFRPMFYFYTPWNRQKTKGFLTYSGGIEMEHWSKNGLNQLKNTESCKGNLMNSILYTNRLKNGKFQHFEKRNYFIYLNYSTC